MLALVWLLLYTVSCESLSEFSRLGIAVTRKDGRSEVAIDWHITGDRKNVGVTSGILRPVVIRIVNAVAPIKVHPVASVYGRDRSRSLPDVRAFLLTGGQRNTLRPTPGPQ